MKNFLCVPDSFKGTLTSCEACKIMEKSILNIIPDAHVLSIPVADGGEGTVDSFLSAIGGEKVPVKVKGPTFSEMDAYYGVIDEGRTAIIEMAVCAGLPLMGDRPDPSVTTTYGVGELILHAVNYGCKRIILGLGGSATNDAGAGAACALGFRFLDCNGEAFIPTGGTLSDVARIDTSHVSKLIYGVDITVMCDVTNPMYGESGAAAVFAPQKGASPEMVRDLDRGLRHISDLFKRDLGRDVSLLPGSGAAGAMGGGMVAFFGARLQSGIDTVLDTVRLDDLLEKTDLVFTGEGKIDSQSIGGKVIAGVAGRAKKHGVPVVAVVGGAEPHIEEIYSMGVSAVFSINRMPEDFSVSRYKSRQNLSLTMENILRLLKI